MRKKTIIALTMGDPSGIGPEVILKGFSKFKKKPYRVLVVGDASYLKKKARRINKSINLNSITDVSENGFLLTKLNVLDMKNLPLDIPSGVANKEAGKASYAYIKKAVDLALREKVSAVTTAPINKKSISMAGLSYAGHTEMLCNLTNSLNSSMMLVGGKIRVVLVSTHVAISEVKKIIKTPKILKTISLTDRSLKLFGIDSPHIAVVGLNPHAGDESVFGSEEKDEIMPAIEMAKNRGINVSGPYSADSLFVKAKKGVYDAVIVMYHDQGLIPVKMEGFGKGVNITLGLPIIRTSVDHGTAYDIVDRGIADSGSLIAALDTAAKLVKAKQRSRF